MTDTPRSTMLLLGHFGGKNTGDEAMLDGFLEAAKLKPEAIHIATKDTNDTWFPRIRTITRLRSSTRSLVHAIRTSEAMVLVGGSHFHDDYPPIRLCRHYLYMARLGVLFRLASLHGLRTGCVGLGLGPFRYRFSRKLVRWIAGSLDAVTVREAGSLEDLRRIGIVVPAVRSFDLASLISTPHSPWEMRAHRLGVSVIGPVNAGAAGEGMGHRALGEVGNALHAAMASDSGLRLSVFVIRGGSRESDVAASNYIVNRLASFGDRVDLVPHNEDPRLTLSRIGECKYFLGTRFHACLLAYLAGCRLLPIAYHRKVSDLAHDIGMSSDWILPLAGITAEKLTSHLRRLLEADPDSEPTLPIREAVESASGGVSWFLSKLALQSTS